MAKAGLCAAATEPNLNKAARRRGPRAVIMTLARLYWRSSHDHGVVTPASAGCARAGRQCRVGVLGGAAARQATAGGSYWVLRMAAARLWVAGGGYWR
jgi:hypothetical protein